MSFEHRAREYTYCATPQKQTPGAAGSGLARDAQSPSLGLKAVHGSVTSREEGPTF